LGHPVSGGNKFRGLSRLGFGMELTTPPRKKQTVMRSEKATAGWTYLRQDMEEAFEEGQDPQRAVEPVMMMMGIHPMEIKQLLLQIHNLDVKQLLLQLDNFDVKQSLLQLDNFDVKQLLLQLDNLNV
jgi:hypothetical protein